MRIDIYGFKAFCENFFKKYTDYYIVLVRISGSAVETIFSQYKHAVGGKLDAANYSSARAANLIKQTVSTHHSGKDYKDKELPTPELLLKKKKYGK